MYRRRLDYVDANLSAQVLTTVESLVDELRQSIAADPNKLRQTRESSLSADLLMLAAYHYALDRPLDQIVDELRASAEAALRVFELRGTEPPFPSTVVTLDIDSPYDAPKVISREIPHPESKDLSLTNSRTGLKAMYMALASGHVLLTRRLAQLIWDPPDADYVRGHSKVCTPCDQHLAYAVKQYILGNETKAREELGQVRGDRQEIALQLPIVRSIIDRDRGGFFNALGSFLKWHEKEAKKKSNRTETDLYLSLPALGLSVLAILRGLTNVAELPRGNPHFPVELLQMTVRNDAG